MAGSWIIWFLAMMAIMLLFPKIPVMFAFGSLVPMGIWMIIVINKYGDWKDYD